jgi:hypothetical protein
MNTSATLSLLSLGPKRKVKCFNEYFVNEYVFHTEEYRQGRKTYNSGVYIKRSTSSEFEVDYYKKIKEVIECNIIVSIIKSFYSNVIVMTPLTEES